MCVRVGAMGKRGRPIVGPLLDPATQISAFVLFSVCMPVCVVCGCTPQTQLFMLLLFPQTSLISTFLKILGEWCSLCQGQITLGMDIYWMCANESHSSIHPSIHTSIHSSTLQ
jgi:hypothetical protein